AVAVVAGGGGVGVAACRLDHARALGGTAGHGRLAGRALVSPRHHDGSHAPGHVRRVVAVHATRHAGTLAGPGAVPALVAAAADDTGAGRVPGVGARRGAGP